MDFKLTKKQLNFNVTAGFISFQTVMVHKLHSFMVKIFTLILKLLTKKPFKVQDFLVEELVHCSSSFNSIYYITHTLNVFFSISGI